MFLFGGYLFFGKYFDAHLYDLEDRPVKYRSGIHLDMKFDDDVEIYLEHETLILDRGLFSNPAQINYKVGGKRSFEWGAFVIEHQCLHPVDGESGGRAAQDYTLAEVRINLL